MAEIGVKEIYRSIQGESTWSGWPCTFVRTVGCDIRCVYCDEPHAFAGGERMTLDAVMERVAALGTRLVEITGGEPLLQRETPALVKRLLDAGHRVLLETGGHHDISSIDPRACVILDVKTPGSGMHARHDERNFARLREGDEIKFVVCDRADYEWARDQVRKHGLSARAPVQLSPVHGVVDPRRLAAWILEDGLDARLNLQLHKYVWGADASGV